MKAYRSLLASIYLWIVSSERLGSVAKYRVYSIYTWGGEIAVALTGLGFAHPILTLAGGTASSEQAPALSDVGTANGLLFVLGLLGLVFWAALKVYVTHGDGVKRATLAKSCGREFNRLRAKLPEILSQQDPRSALLDLRNEIQKVVDRHTAEDAWPAHWKPFAPGIDREVERRVDELCQRFGENWLAPPAVDQVPQGAQS